MNIEDTRVANTKLLIATRFGGTAARFAEAIGRQSGYVSRVLAGKKGFGEEFARDIERILDLGRGYLDREADDATALPPDDQRFIGEISSGLQERDIPDHIRQTILTLIASSPVKK